MYNIFLGLIYIWVAYDIYTTGYFLPSIGNILYFGMMKIPFSILLFIIGVYHIVFYKRVKYTRKNDLFDESKYYSICPKCEKSFVTSELKDRMCPYCDVKTENLEGYYDNNKQ